MIFVYNKKMEVISMVKKLGFGCMRMPLLDEKNTESIDKEKMTKMIDKFIEEGFTYFDT